MSRRAQGILEYAIVLLTIIAALLIMGYYVRGGLSGKIREAADTYGQGEVYAPDVGSNPNKTVASVTITNSK